MNQTKSLSPYIPQVPEDWDTPQIKYCFNIKLGKMIQNDPITDADEHVPYLKAVNVNWLNVDTDTDNRMWASPNQINRFGIQTGDLLISEGGDVGRSGMVKAIPNKCIIQNALHRVRSRDNSNNKFLYYYMSNIHSSGWLDIICNKATIAHLTFEKLGALQISLPSLSVQNKIISFLDRETTRIDNLISLKQKQIELLKEKRQGIITQAVTKGLDPDVQMKDSGVEWIGEIPEHWEIWRLRHIVSLKSGSGITSEKIEENEAYPVYGGNGLRGFYSNYTHKGDYVLIGRQGALCGNINYASGRFWASEHAVVATPLIDLKVTWLGEILRMMNLNQYSVSAAQPGLAVDRIKDLRLPIPPLAEQEKIEIYLKKYFMKQKGLILKIKKSIELLEEYRSSLITHAVSGQIDIYEYEATHE